MTEIKLDWTLLSRTTRMAQTYACHAPEGLAGRLTSDWLSRELAQTYGLDVSYVPTLHAVVFGLESRHDKLRRLLWDMRTYGGLTSEYVVALGNLSSQMWGMLVDGCVGLLPDPVRSGRVNSQRYDPPRKPVPLRWALFLPERDEIRRTEEWKSYQLLRGKLTDSLLLSMLAEEFVTRGHAPTVDPNRAYVELTITDLFAKTYASLVAKDYPGLSPAVDDAVAVMRTESFTLWARRLPDDD